jgi:hypothetical protein
MSGCVNCGFEIAPGDAFCAGCGSAQPAPVTQAAPAWAARAAGAAGRTTTGQGANGAVAAGPGYQPPGGDGGGPEPRFARSSPPVLARSDLELKYMRQTRTACVFIAVIVGIFTALLVVGTIWGVVRYNNLQNQLNNGLNNLGNSNCSSQGGTNPNC